MAYRTKGKQRTKRTERERKEKVPLRVDFEPRVDELAVRGEEPVKLLSEKHDEQSWEEATKPDEKVAA